jgi:hypothetical protein
MSRKSSSDFIRAIANVGDRQQITIVADQRNAQRVSVREMSRVNARRPGLCRLYVIPDERERDFDLFLLRAADRQSMAAILPKLGLVRPFELGLQPAIDVEFFVQLLNTIIAPGP